MAKTLDINTGRLPHACLISAPSREEGMREAKRLAMSAVCSSPGEKPCGLCRDCRKAAEGIHPDISIVSRPVDDSGKEKREINVEQIRSMIADAYVRPNEAARKVYIIDQAQTMNPAAQNAALKLLEEPPAGAVFLLTTENAAQILPTVRSRCADINIAGEQQELDKKLLELADKYLRLVAAGSRAELLSWCVQNEDMDLRTCTDFMQCIRLRLLDIACGRTRLPGLSKGDALRLTELVGSCCARLKVNSGVKHIFGLLAVDSISGSRNTVK